MKKLEIYCITNKVINFIDHPTYKIGWVSKDKPPNNYISCNKKNNIFFKEKYYSELTFQYWHWKNILNINDNHWIGFCQKRRFWLKKKLSGAIINRSDFSEHVLQDAPNDWNDYNAIICEPISVNKVKKVKMLKRGLRSIIKDPSIFFNEKKQSLLLNFDMHHGYGNLKKAINVMDQKDRNEFLDYVNINYTFNPHIMFIAKSDIHQQWFSTLFPWLERCEKIFGFESLTGYDTQRLYAFLAERYLSFWFKKYTNYLEWPWVFHDNKN